MCVQCECVRVGVLNNRPWGRVDLFTLPSFILRRNIHFPDHFLLMGIQDASEAKCPQ